MTGLRRALGSQSGASLPEVLVGLIVGSLVLTGVTSAIFTTNDLRLRTDDRSQLASDLATLSLRFDRDAAMATPTAPARSQVGSTSCATPIDLGFTEAGGSVQYRTVAGSPAGPLWLQRVNGAGARTIASNVSSCSWQVSAAPSGRLTIQVSLVLAGTSGETLSPTLRGAPRLW
jgi:Tfp pilus assembly protein PilW